MKKVFLAIAVASVFVACNNGEATDTPKVDSPAVETPKVDSPAVAAPKADSPAVMAPKVDSPAVKTAVKAKK
jgi:PBP1b-binding outer membrane lipoprotein LpoB